MVEISRLEQHSKEGFRVYQELLKLGWPRELARLSLSVNTYSKMFTTLNLHNLFHYLSLRMDEHAQWEHQQYAKALIELMTPVVPIAVAAWNKQQALWRRFETFQGYHNG